MAKNFEIPLINGRVAVDTTSTYCVSVALPLNGDSVDQNFFIAMEPVKVLAISESHATAGTDGSAVSAVVKKATGTTAIASGTAIMSNSFDMKGTANTVQNAAMATSSATVTLASGDRLGVDYTGAVTSLAGVVITLLLQKV